MSNGKARFQLKKLSNFIHLKITVYINTMESILFMVQMHYCIWAKQKTKQLVHASLKMIGTYGHLLLLKFTLGVLDPG